MTIGLTALSLVLAAALGIVANRLLSERRRLGAQLAEAESARAALQSELDGACSEVLDAERRDAANLRMVEAAERLRVEREWGELAGPGVDLPAAWDGSLGCVVANELEIIREVVGTPSTLEIAGEAAGAVPGDGYRLALSAEFLRAAARASDEMHVTIDGSVVVRASCETTPDLHELAAAVERGGADVVVEASSEGFKASLRFSHAAGT